MIQTINGFQVLRKIAESNTAEIFHVIRLVGRGRGNEYAVKALRGEFAGDRTERTYLETEYRICSALQHKNLIYAHEVNLGAQRPFLVMDLVQGASLRTYLERGRPRLGQALGWLAQVAEGLAYLHAEGYVHRDVKPQNTVIGDDGEVRIIDFALAIKEDTSFGQHLMRKLRERKRPGTWSYMSPEQIRNQRITAQADLYGLGVTLFEVSTGRLPYAAETPQALLELHLYAPLPSMRTLRPDAPPALDDLVRALMAKDPAERPRGMAYVGSRLQALAMEWRNLP